MKSLTLRIEDSDHAAITFAAEMDGRSLNSWIIRKLMSAETPPPSKPVLVGGSVMVPSTGEVLAQPSFGKCDECQGTREVRWFYDDGPGEWKGGCLACYLKRNPKMQKIWLKAPRKPLY